MGRSSCAQPKSALALPCLDRHPSPPWRSAPPSERPEASPASYSPSMTSPLRAEQPCRTGRAVSRLRLGLRLGPGSAGPGCRRRLGSSRLRPLAAAIAAATAFSTFSSASALVAAMRARLQLHLRHHLGRLLLSGFECLLHGGLRFGLAASAAALTAASWSLVPSAGAALAFVAFAAAAGAPAAAEQASGAEERRRRHRAA